MPTCSRVCPKSDKSPSRAKVNAPVTKPNQIDEVVAAALSDDPERALAVLHAPAAARPALAALFALDRHLGGIVAGTTQPAIGQMRLLWWRDALAALDAAPPPAEPLLAAVARALLPAGVSGAELAAMIEGWAVLLDADMLDPDAIAAHGRGRGAVLFALAARLLAGGGDVAAAGEGWALADLAARLSEPGAAATAWRQAQARFADAPRRWPRRLRAIGMLAMLARVDAARAERPARGTPGRVLRMLAHRLSGR